MGFMQRELGCISAYSISAYILNRQGHFLKERKTSQNKKSWVARSQIIERRVAKSLTMVLPLYEKSLQNKKTQH